jgi:hypothetical protein
MLSLTHDGLQVVAVEVGPLDTVQLGVDPVQLLRLKVDAEGEVHDQARTGRGIHGLPKVSCGPAQPNLYTPCGRATPQTAWTSRSGGIVKT